MAETITIQTTDGPFDVEVVYRKGFFAVHRSDRRDESLYGRYTITHIPTGRYVDFQETLKAAAVEVRSLQADPAVNWDFTDPHRGGDTDAIKRQHDRLLIARREAWDSLPDAGVK